MKISEYFENIIWTLLLLLERQALQISSTRLETSLVIFHSSTPGFIKELISNDIKTFQTHSQARVTYVILHNGYNIIDIRQ